MTKKLSVIHAGAIGLAMAFACAGAGAQSSPLPHSGTRTPGYMDGDGVFHAAARMEEAPDTTATTETLGGTFQFKVTITLDTAVPTGGKVECTASVTEDTFNATTYNAAFIDEGAMATASPNTSCTVKIPYSWIVPTPSATMQNSYTSTIAVTILSSTGAIVRTHLQNVANMAPIPANNTTTTSNVSVTM